MLINFKKELFKYVSSFFFTTCKYHAAHVVEKVKTT